MKTTVLLTALVLLIQISNRDVLAQFGDLTGGLTVPDVGGLAGGALDKAVDTAHKILDGTGGAAQIDLPDAGVTVPDLTAGGVAVPDLTAGGVAVPDLTAGVGGALDTASDTIKKILDGGDAGGAPVAGGGNDTDSTTDPTLSGTQASIGNDTDSTNTTSQDTGTAIGGETVATPIQTDQTPPTKPSEGNATSTAPRPSDKTPPTPTSGDDATLVVPTPTDKTPPTATSNATATDPDSDTTTGTSKTTDGDAQGGVGSRIGDGDDDDIGGKSSGSSGGHASKILIVLLLWTSAVVVLYLIVVNYRKVRNLWGYFCVCGVSPNSGVNEPKNYRRTTYETYRSKDDADL